MSFLSSQFSILIAGIFMAVLAVSEAYAAEDKQEIQIPPGFEMLKGSTVDTKGWASDIRHKATGIEMVYVAPGVFMMGSPSSEKDRRENETQHKVKLTKGYYIGKYEVTQEQWKKVMGKKPSKFKGVDLPVEQVSWDECKSFCKKLDEMTAPSALAEGELPNGEGYHFRLPSEAEWEYAARGGNRNKGFTYGGSNNLDSVGWYYENSGDVRLSDSGWNIDKSIGNNGRTHPVGQKRANELGLYDMSGNVWEWCSDLIGDYPAGEEAIDPTGAATGAHRVHRGGGWYGVSWNCRLAARSGITPDSSGCYLGFRLAMDIPKKK